MFTLKNMGETNGGVSSNMGIVIQGDYDGIYDRQYEMYCSDCS